MLKLAISPCPNDTFAFYGLLHGKTSFSEKVSVDFQDIETLNQACRKRHYDFCKISFHAFLNLYESHWMLDSGSALGFGCGPLVVSRSQMDSSEIGTRKIAIPGFNTTAFLLLELFAGKDFYPVEMSFDRILESVQSGVVDLGLIIHESRFTYQNYGLHQVLDLGAWWEQESGHAIPLGGIVADRTLNADTVLRFQNALRESIDYAWSHLDEVKAFMKDRAQEMDDQVMMKHVELYVNKFTRSLGEEGRGSVRALFNAVHPDETISADDSLFFTVDGG